MIQMINNRLFDFDAVDNCFNDLLKIEGVDEFTVSNDAVSQINTLLGVNTKEDEESIRAIRNAVVKRFGALTIKALHIKDGDRDPNYNPTPEEAHKDFEEYKRWNTWMSAITASIDSYLFHKGFAV